MKVEFRSNGNRRFGDQGNNWLHKRLWFNNKRNDLSAFVPVSGDLARMLILGENQGDYTEKQRRCARHGIRD